MGELVGLVLLLWLVGGWVGVLMVELLLFLVVRSWVLVVLGVFRLVLRVWSMKVGI